MTQENQDSSTEQDLHNLQEKWECVQAKVAEKKVSAAFKKNNKTKHSSSYRYHEGNGPFMQLQVWSQRCELWWCQCECGHKVWGWLSRASLGIQMKHNAPFVKCVICQCLLRTVSHLGVVWSRDVLNPDLMIWYDIRIKECILNTNLKTLFCLLNAIYISRYFPESSVKPLV